MFVDITNETWWNSFLTEWNRREEARSLAGLGTVTFVVLSETESDSEYDVSIRWDDDGIGSFHSRTESTRRIAASAEVWNRFLSGVDDPVKLILTRQMHHSGDLGTLLGFLPGFREVPVVARSTTI